DLEWIPAVRRHKQLSAELLVRGVSSGKLHLPCVPIYHAEPFVKYPCCGSHLRIARSVTATAIGTIPQRTFCGRPYRLACLCAFSMADPVYPNRTTCYRSVGATLSSLCISRDIFPYPRSGSELSP